MELKNLVSDRRVTSLLLMGSLGLSMREDGLALASHLLSTEKLDNHPDFLLVEPQEGKKSIGVEDILPVIRLGINPPIHAKYSVALIDGMNLLTVAAQNKLLVLLESNPYVFIIGVAYEDTVLDTVKSRMRVVTYSRSTWADFVASCDMNVEEAELFYYATSGCLGLVPEFKSEKDMFLSLKKLCSVDADRSGLFKALHLVKEKDKLSVTEDRQLMLGVLRILQFVFKERAVESYKINDAVSACLYLDIFDRLVSDERKCAGTNYSKDDFFNTVVYCVEH